MNSTASSSMAIALYFLLGCSIIHFPSTQGKATCSGGKLKSGDPLATARGKVFGTLMTKTFSAYYKQRCTYDTATGTGATSSTMYVYGVANCVVLSSSCGGDEYCSARYQQCSTCLREARRRLMKKCGKRVGGFVVVVQKPLQCSLQFSDRRLCP
ncbi:unnamed protein product [Linum trigynum]|uniref:Gnk2-homologous domain-containing protein n=1 Tax=Linum trigynum TaxID=586398 RepID=A0AAV2DSI9_9ROSI